jgi:hypothetical protein
MTSMWKRGSQRQYPGTTIAHVCLSDDHGIVSACSEQELLSSTGSPP